MLIHTELPADLPKAEKKEMFSHWIDEEGTCQIRINFSSMDLLQTCLRKSFLSLVRELRSDVQSPALTFGSGIHAAMEVWYAASHLHRNIGSVNCDDNHALMLAGQEPLKEHGSCARCASIWAFMESVRGKLTESHEARSPENAIHILNNYFDTYLDDPYDLLIDGDGPF